MTDPIDLTAKRQSLTPREHEERRAAGPGEGWRCPKSKLRGCDAGGEERSAMRSTYAFLYTALRGEGMRLMKRLGAFLVFLTLSSCLFALALWILCPVAVPFERTEWLVVLAALFVNVAFSAYTVRVMLAGKEGR